MEISQIFYNFISKIILNLRFFTCKSILDEYLTFLIFRQIFQSLLLNLLIFLDRYSIRQSTSKNYEKIWGLQPQKPSLDTPLRTGACHRPPKMDFENEKYIIIMYLFCTILYTESQILYTIPSCAIGNSDLGVW